MDKAFFKIVIPNYNGMAYIRQCLDSVLGQTFRDFKIVLVDDLSDDLSYEFAKMYERKHPDKLVVLRPAEKKMAGGCRNVGIDWPLECQYLCFVDSDDYLCSPKSLETMKRCVEANMPGLALFDWYVDVGGKLVRNRFGDFEEFVKARDLAQSPWNASWTRLVRSDMSERFLENCMRGEDTYQMLRILDKSPSVEQFHECVYAYRQHAGNTVRQKVFQDHKPVFKNALRGLREKCRSRIVAESISKRLGE